MFFIYKHIIIVLKRKTKVLLCHTVFTDMGRASRRTAQCPLLINTCATHNLTDPHNTSRYTVDSTPQRPFHHPLLEM